MNTKIRSHSKDLSDYSLEELVTELSRRRANGLPTDMLSAEEALGKRHDQDRNTAFAVYLLRLSQEETNEPKRCPKCGTMSRVRARLRQRNIRTVTGSHLLKRNQHYCDACKESFYPLDIELGLSKCGEASPDLERRLLDFGVTGTFREAEERWSVHYNKPISENFVRCVVERSQHIITSAKLNDVQEVSREIPPQPADLLVVQTDGGMLPIRGSESWKESKLGVIYREEHHLVSSNVQRGCVTQARYVAHLGSVKVFKKHMHAALEAEQSDEAKEVIWLGDGAVWNWNMADELCPQAIQILDVMHAIEHATDCAKILFGDDDIMIAMWVNRIKDIFYHGDTQALFDELGACRFGANQAECATINELMRYYTNNRSRIEYVKFKEHGYSIGSGAVESAHKHVLQKRMKLAGQHWDIRRAKGMVELRAVYRTAGPANLYPAICKLRSRIVELGKRAA